jgi:hypothetical protein
MGKYWRIVFRRAISEAWLFVFDHPGRFMIGVLVTWIGTLGVRLEGSEGAWRDAAIQALWGFAAIFGTFFLLFIWKLVVLPSRIHAEQEGDIKKLTKSSARDQVEINITKVRFDPNGPKVFYIHFILDNLGEPTVLRKWLISVNPVDGEAFSVNPEHILTKYIPDLHGPGTFEDLSITPFEKGGSRNGVVQYTHKGDVLLLKKVGTIFRLSVMDIKGRELCAQHILNIEDVREP